MIFFTGLFIFLRLSQLTTLIPIIGMLSWFVDGYTKNKQLTPTFILVLFIVSVLASIWVILTLFRLGSTKRSAYFVAFGDLLFFGSFIASVVLLRGISRVSCRNFTTGSMYIDLGIFGYYGNEGGANPGINLRKNCSMITASFAFAIVNVILFFLTTSLIPLMRKKDSEKTTQRHSHHRSSARHGPERRHHSRSPRRSSTYV